MVYVIQFFIGMIGSYVGLFVLKQPLAIFWCGVITVVVVLILTK